MNETFVEQLACAFRKVGTIHSVGEEWVSYIGEIPVGGVPYCGQIVTRETYSALWSYAQAKGLVKTEAEWQELAAANNGNVPYYSDGDGSTTFRMPKIVGYVKGAASQSVAGDYIAEGLPNIEGKVGHVGTLLGIADSRVGSSEGSLYYEYHRNELWECGAGSGAFQYLNLDASKSNAIYGNSDHVTPETSVVMFGVYAFGAIVETSALDATTLSQAVARVESNLDSKMDGNKVHIVETWQNGTSWYRVWSDGRIEQGGKTGKGASQTVTFPKAFTNKSSILFYSVMTPTTNAVYNYINYIDSVTTTKATFVIHSDATSTWYACGH